MLLFKKGKGVYGMKGKKCKKRGQAFIVGLMIAFMGIVTIFILIPLLSEQVTLVRAADKLDCANTSIITGNKMTCIVADLSVPYYAVVGLGVACSYVFIKRFIESDFGG